MMSESETPSPEEIREMSEEEREEWFDKRSSELEEAVEEEMKLSPSEQEAFEALEESEGETVKVDIGRGIEVDVKTHLSARIEDNLDRVASNRASPAAVREEIIETLVYMIEDEDYSSEKVWRQLGDRFGTLALSEKFFAVVEPAIDRMEGVDSAQRFRKDR